MNSIFIIALIGFTGIKIAHDNAQEKIRSTLEKLVPVGAVNYLNQNPDLGRILNSYNWGAYLIWAVPEYPVFVDGRTDVFDDEILRQYITMVYAGEGWEILLQKWDIEVVLLEPGSPLIQLLKQKQWIVKYQDSISILLVEPNAR